MNTRNDRKNIPDIVLKYIDDRCESHERAEAQRWLNENINRPEFDMEFRKILDQTIPDLDMESIERTGKVLDAFMALETAGRKRERRTRRLFASLAAAAIAAAIAAFAIIFNKPEPIEWHEIYAQRGKTERLILPDGTSLWMNSDTKVIYPSRFDGRTRTIYIDGEIYADVTHDKKKPFIVSSSDVRVKVHGTQFRMKAFAEMDNVEVALISGSVTMEDCNHENGVSRMLKPGDMVRYNKHLGTIEDYRINTDTYGAWQNNHNIRFINQNLKDIAIDLERRFNVKILIEDETLSKTQYYASFINNEGLDKILQTLNSDGSMKIYKKHDTIVISPKKQY